MYGISDTDPRTCRAIRKLAARANAPDRASPLPSIGASCRGAVPEPGTVLIRITPTMAIIIVIAVRPRSRSRSTNGEASATQIGLVVTRTTLFATEVYSRDV